MHDAASRLMVRKMAMIEIFLLCRPVDTFDEERLNVFELHASTNSKMQLPAHLLQQNTFVHPLTSCHCPSFALQHIYV